MVEFEKRYCKCGCGGIPKGKNSRFCHGHYSSVNRKGKTYKEIYGKEKANIMRDVRGRGKTYKEIYGKEKAEELKAKRRKTLEERFSKEEVEQIKLRLGKGKTYEERYGKEKAKELKLAQCRTYEERFGGKKAEQIKLKLGKGKTLEERYGKGRARQIRIKIGKRKKGKTLEEIYGKGRARQIRLKSSRTRKAKGRTYEEIYGKERAEKLKIKCGKGKTFIERYGEERAKQIGAKISKAAKGKTLIERFGEEKANKIKRKRIKSGRLWTKEKIEKKLKDIIEIKGQITKRSELSSLHHRYDICTVNTMRKVFGSTDNLAVELGIEFAPNFHRGLGINEKQILDDIEIKNDTLLFRQYQVAGKFIDGYDKTNNIAYEVDEQHHKYQRIEDKIREDKIKKVLGCEFVRVRG